MAGTRLSIAHLIAKRDRLPDCAARRSKLNVVSSDDMRQSSTFKTREIKFNGSVILSNWILGIGQCSVNELDGLLLSFTVAKTRRETVSVIPAVPMLKYLGQIFRLTKACPEYLVVICARFL